MKTPSNLIRECYAAYESKNRQAIEELLADDFTFSSPLDDNISRARYFERCWPNSEHIEAFHIEQLFVEGNQAFVRYEATQSGGQRFRNTEFFTIEGGKIRHVDVYFGSEDPSAANEAEIRALIDATAKACRAKDVAALIANYAPDVLAFDVINPLRYTGADAVAQRAAQWFSSFHGSIAYDITDLHIAAANETAFCYSLNHVHGTKTDGQHIDMWWRATLGCEKRDGKWMVTHLHSSVPFDMETGNASIGLKP